MASPLEALATLRAAADDGRLDALCAAYGVRLLGVFGGRGPTDSRRRS